MRIGFSLGLALLGAVVVVGAAQAAPMKVACTGTSAMMGLGSTAGHHVPDEMGKDLGPNFEVHNYGVQGTTAIMAGGTSYAATSQYKAALALNPDIVLFWFGGNDSFKGEWDQYKGQFKADYTAMVKAFQNLPSHPKTFLVRLWVFVQAPVQQTVIDKEILPIIDQIGAETGSVLIDYRKAFEMHREYFPDGMHPNDTGTLAIGKLFADTVTQALMGGGTGGAMGTDAATGNDGGGADVASVETAPMMGTGGSSGGSGGASGSSGGSSGATGGSSPPATGTGGVPAQTGGSSGGCAIATAPGAGPVALLALALLWIRRLRRRRQ